MNVWKYVILTLMFAAVFGLSTAAIAAPISTDHLQLVLADSTLQAEKTPGPTKTKTPGAENPNEDKLGAERVAQAIAKYFDVPVTEITAFQAEGMGFGEIVKAYALAKTTGMPVDNIFALRAQDQGWGAIVKSLAIAKWNVSVGNVMRNEAAKKDAVDNAPGNSGEHRNDQGKGKPEDKGRPDDKGKPDNKGKNK